MSLLESFCCKNPEKTSLFIGTRKSGLQLYTFAKISPNDYPLKSKMPNDLVHLNVGGQRFSTSKNTLTSLQGEETFFTSLLSGRIASNMDETGAYFIDRDPELFRLILNFLRTQQLHLLVQESDAKQLSALIHEVDGF